MYNFHNKLHWTANHLQKQCPSITDGVTDKTVHLPRTMNRAITGSISCNVCDQKIVAVVTTRNHNGFQGKQK